MDAPPIPRLVDLVHAFKGVVVEQFKKRLEKLLSDSILLRRLLKLLFKILQGDNPLGGGGGEETEKTRKLARNKKNPGISSIKTMLLCCFGEIKVSNVPFEKRG